MKGESKGVKEEYFLPHETIRCLLLCIVLLIIGFLSIIFALNIGTQSPRFIIPLTIGVTCIVSLTMVIVEYILRRQNIKLTKSFFDLLKGHSEELIDRLKERIEEKAGVTEEKMDRIDRKLELAGKLIDSGVIDISSDRWENEKGYHEKIRRYLSEYSEQIRRGEVTEKEIRIMGIALRHFFQIETYREELKELRGLDVKFRVLILDAKSDAALERSKIESPEVWTDYLEELTDEEKENLFLNTAMFRDLYGVHEYIVDYSPPWIKKKFEIRYYENEPSYYLIRFPDKLIIENYHYGSVKECDIPSDRPTPFIGGRIPIFVYDSECATYKLISNHFEQIWRRSSITPEDRDPFFRKSIQQRASQQK